jgi:hypothetical protein
MDQVSIKYTNIFHRMTLQNFPKFGFLVWKQTIWQPCSAGQRGLLHFDRLRIFVRPKTNEPTSANFFDHVAGVLLFFLYGPPARQACLPWRKGWATVNGALTISPELRKADSVRALEFMLTVASTQRWLGTLEQAEVSGVARFRISVRGQQTWRQFLKRG